LYIITLKTRPFGVAELQKVLKGALVTKNSLNIKKLFIISNDNFYRPFVKRSALYRYAFNRKRYGNNSVHPYLYPEVKITPFQFYLQAILKAPYLR
jgi:hypothetical protein